MTFESDPPYCLAGPWVPYLTVIVTTVLAGDRGVDAVADVPRSLRSVSDHRLTLTPVETPLCSIA